MKTISKHNKHIYNEYQKSTEKFQNNYKASGYCSLSAWRLRRSLLNHMVKFLDYTNLDILDMGCNNGLTGRELCNAFNRRNVKTNIDGIDFVESALMIAKTTFNYRTTFVADITDKKLISAIMGARKYPLVHCCEVFHYINPDDYNNFFTIVHSLLNPGGYFLLVMPNVRSICHLIVKTVRQRIFNGSFKYNYDVPFIKSLFKEFSFGIVSICGAEILTGLIMDLNKNNKFKNLLSYEIAILAKKA